jgi:hypothetical protein
MPGVSIPLLIAIPLVVVAIIIIGIFYLRQMYLTRRLNQNIKEKPLPDLFSNVYLSHKAFKKENVAQAPESSNTNLKKPGSAGTMGGGNLTKTVSELSLFREETLTAAPLIYSGPKSAPAYPGQIHRKKSQEIMV